MLDYRSTVAASAILAGALLVGCAEPDEPTDLRRDGPPNITAVTVMSDLETASDPDPIGIGQIVETATYCRVGDEKRPGIVGLPDIRVVEVCPAKLADPAPGEGVAEAAPPVWFVRIVFDKLLDPSIEELVPDVDANNQPTGKLKGTFKNTQPVVLTCNGADVPYDGYYVPNGNRSSWPLGPALFIQPLDPTKVPTESSCTVSIKDNVHNKAQQSVPAEQRSFRFKIGPMVFRFSDPDPSDGIDGAITRDPKTPVDFFWTAPLQEGTPAGPEPGAVALSTIDPAQIKIFSGPNVGVGPGTPDGNADTTVCNGGGTAVDPSLVRAYLAGPDVGTTELILRLDLKGGTPAMATAWAPNTTYRITFTPAAKVKTRQGGAEAGFPADFKLCFHTTE
jgi:hypothetical protein